MMGIKHVMTLKASDFFIETDISSGSTSLFVGNDERWVYNDISVEKLQDLSKQLQELAAAMSAHKYFNEFE